MREKARWRDLEAKVAEELTRAGFEVKRHVGIDGIYADFVAADSNGKTYVIETKAWDASRKNQARAAEQAKYYKAASGATAAYVVMEGLRRSNPFAGLVSLEDLVGVLKSRKEEKSGRSPTRPDIEENPRRKIAAAMPFDLKYDDVYFVAMKYAAKRVNATCIRVDKEHFQGDIVDQIKRLIFESTAVIADLSEANPNVLYEIGYAHALNRPTVHICSTPLNDLPFDVRNWNTLKYSLGQTHRLKVGLANRLQAVLRGVSARSAL